MDLLGLPLVIFVLLVVNLASFGAFCIDKIQAEAGAWRISEATLLLWTFVSGTPGAYAGRHLFRHKTRKQPFSDSLHRIAIFQFAALVGLALFLIEI